MAVNSLDQMDLQGKKALIRADYNVPLKDGVIQDDTRVRANVPTVKRVLDKGGAAIVCSHLGSPKNGFEEKLSLKPVAARLSELLGRPVKMAPGVIDDATRKMAAELKPGEVLLLENLRFEAGEKKNDEAMAKALASMADVYVSDAFGAAHRAHASVAAVAGFAKKCCAGLLMEKELHFLDDALNDPKRPLVAISGGAKVSSKLNVLRNLLGKVDAMIIGGAMANTFLKAMGYKVGKSLVEDDLLDAAKEIMAQAKEKGVNFHLPVDFVVARSFDADAPEATVDAKNIPDDMMALDVGPATVELYAKALASAKTVVWNGPMGAFENKAFAAGSIELGKRLAALDVIKIVGGGDTDSLVHQAGLADKFTFISTGGGSFMEFLEGKDLPAVAALRECANR